MIFYTSRQSESVLGFNSNPKRVHEINDNIISFVSRNWLTAKQGDLVKVKADPVAEKGHLHDY